MSLPNVPVTGKNTFFSLTWVLIFMCIYPILFSKFCFHQRHWKMKGSITE